MITIRYIFVTPILPSEDFYVKFFVVRNGSYGDPFPILKLDFPHSHAIMGAYTKYLKQCFLLWDYLAISQAPIFVSITTLKSRKSLSYK